MIKVEVDNLKSDIDTLMAAIDDFKPYGKEYITKIKDSIEDFNSDFIEKIVVTLDNMKDTKAQDLVCNLDDFCESLKCVVEGFEEVDSDIADSTENNILGDEN